MHTHVHAHVQGHTYTRTVKYSCGIDNPQESSKGSQLAQAWKEGGTSLDNSF